MKMQRRTRNVAVFSGGPWYRRLRLWTGLVLFTYVLTHFVDHASGNISLEAMEAILRIQKRIWQSAAGTFLLYGSLGTHAALGVWSLYARRYTGWTPLEIVQLVLGLCVPPLLANHLAVTRGALAIYGLDKAYAQELATLWVVLPILGVVQVGLLTVAWCHAWIGLTTAFRLKRWYENVRAPLLAFAILMPSLALLGFVNGAREVERRMQDPFWRQTYLDATHTGTAAQVNNLFEIRNIFIGADVLLLIMVLLARGVRARDEMRHRGIAIRYPDGRVARIPIGLTVLDASRMIGFPHASICGGRGRCSTCRVRVLPVAPATELHLPLPVSSERAVLARIVANPALIRLACQLRPREAIRVQPLVPPDLAGAFIVGRSAIQAGEERFVVAMFVDLQGSTRLVEGRLPFDAVFLLRRFIEVATAAVVRSGGIAGQFTGDGILALFGVASPPDIACRQALNSLSNIAGDMRAFSAATASDHHDILRYGIGMACGLAVVGEVAVHRHLTLTALGEVVHVAARLQSATRDHGCDAVVAEAVFEHAGIEWPGLKLLELQLRGRDTPVTARLLRLGQDPIGQERET